MTFHSARCTNVLRVSPTNASIRYTLTVLQVTIYTRINDTTVTGAKVYTFCSTLKNYNVVLCFLHSQITNQ